MAEIQFCTPAWGFPNQELADPELILFYRNLGRRSIWINDEITLESLEFIVQWIEDINIQDDMEGWDGDTRMPIIIHIASPGGDMNIMQLVYDVIINSKTPIYTINETYAHSGAFLIFLAGHKRFMRPQATFIAHEGSIYLGGNHKESREAMKRYEQEVKNMIQMIADRTTLTVEEIDDHFSQESDWYIDYEQALEKGILTDPGLPEPNRYPIKPKVEEVTKLDVTLKTDEKENTNV